MGFLGWTYDQVENTPFGAIETAYEGRMEMLRMCFGSGDEVPEQPQVLPAENVFSAFRAAGAPRP